MQVPISIQTLVQGLKQTTALSSKRNYNHKITYEISIVLTVLNDGSGVRFSVRCDLGGRSIFKVYRQLDLDIRTRPSVVLKGSIGSP